MTHEKLTLPKGIEYITKGNRNGADTRQFKQILNENELLTYVRFKVLMVPAVEEILSFAM
jgi:hypothetical protein